MRRYVAQLHSGIARAVPVRRTPYRRRAAAAASVLSAVPAQQAGTAHAFSAFDADLERGLPPGMAVLLVLPVLRDGKRGFRLRGVCCCGVLQDFPESAHPDIELANLVARSGIPPTKVIATMRRWSQNMTKLTTWLHERRCEHGDALQLMVWDETGYGIPWELFWLEAPPGSSWREGWLGGLVTMTRWLTINAAWSVVRDYATSHTCAGPVASFVADDMRHDDALLSRFASETIPGIRGLSKTLATGQPLGMVYVACHGKFESDEDDCRLGDVPLVMLEGGGRFGRLASAATFVFLNACHSGRLLAGDGTFADQAQRGFSEVFLRSGAAGVLATSGEVGDEEAHQMAGELLKLLCERPQMPVAAALRELRSVVAHLMPADLFDAEANEEQRRLLPLLYRFMYVYYGSPRTTVALAPCEGWA
ncbi:CHAT domain-containing protein [Streptomyces sp. SP2-10]|uniref:CHAT domain-containing protein n=1 Tax=Streptomyces sp. SP2-10 TaxID=2873385 RepID=UPI001CA7279C|nr:CHAT domain-containing protein [Streptomyces sp. SP2-10]MBY8846057.1 CHAT domain-containing protein [Streptomyces sp. SP2-10]